MRTLLIRIVLFAASSTSMSGPAQPEGLLCPAYARTEGPSDRAGREIRFFATAFNDRHFTYAYPLQLGASIDWSTTIWRSRGLKRCRCKCRTVDSHPRSAACDCARRISTPARRRRLKHARCPHCIALPPSAVAATSSAAQGEGFRMEIPPRRTCRIARWRSSIQRRVAAPENWVTPWHGRPSGAARAQPPPDQEADCLFEEIARWQDDRSQ